MKTSISLSVLLLLKYFLPFTVFSQWSTNPANGVEASNRAAMNHK